jgi:spore coat polysaccharide biosynthesis protein SpsF
MKKKVIAIIQARMKSSRLPDKVMLDIQGKPMLTRVIERVRLARHIDRVVVATTSGADEDPIANLCQVNEVDCYRGSLQDVLDRYYQAARPYQPDIVVRITADCPLIDPGLINETVDVMIGGGTPTAIWKPQADADKYPPATNDIAWDYASTRLPPPWHRTFPIGLDVEACRFEALERAWKEARAPFEREHVMPYFYDLPNRFRCIIADWTEDLGFHRWTVDTEADLALIREVYARLEGNPFTWQDVLALFEQDPDLIKINAGIYHKDFREVDSRRSK